MKTLSVDANQEELTNLVIEWIELLAQENYAKALDFILYDNTQEVDGKIWKWTPERLEASVYTCGLPWYSKDEMRQLYGVDYPVDGKVTSILNRQDKEVWLDGDLISIHKFDGVISSQQAELWGISHLDYQNIIGEIMFDGVPIDGKRSDLTALFWIKKLDSNQITLIFRDLHMM